MTKYRYHLIDAVAAFALLLMVLLRAGQKLDHSGVAEMDALNVHDLAILRLTSRRPSRVTSDY